MNRPLALIIALALAVILVPRALQAQVILGPEGPLNPQKEKQKQREGPQVFHLTVDPAPEPSPALKYSLLPYYLQQKPGNGVPYYYRALLMYRQGNATARDSIAGWSDTPAAQLPAEQVRRALDQFTGVIESLRTAAYREQCDWQWRLRDLDGLQQIAFLLPELNDARSVGRLLALKARLEIAEGHYDQAIETLTIGYKLARDVAEPSTLVNCLVGIAIGDVMNRVLIELIDAPGSPNLYWALAELPRPLIDTRQALRQEMMLPLQMFPVLRDPETAQHSPDQWRDLMIQCVRQTMDYTDLGLQAGGLGKDRFSEAAALGLIAVGYPRAKSELEAAGYSRQQIEKMPVGQVVAIYQARAYAHAYAEIFKWTFLPFDEAWQRQQQAERKLQDEGYFDRFPNLSREIIPVVSVLLPDLGAARRAEVRLSARLAMLKALEAIRMHAAAHEGQLPNSLDQIVTVPVPNNPLTGEPFVYRREGEMAFLEIPEAVGMDAAQAWRLEIVVSKR